MYSSETQTEHVGLYAANDMTLNTFETSVLQPKHLEHALSQVYWWFDTNLRRVFCPLQMQLFAATFSKFSQTDQNFRPIIPQ